MRQTGRHCAAPRGGRPPAQSMNAGDIFTTTVATGPRAIEIGFVSSLVHVLS